MLCSINAGRFSSHVFIKIFLQKILVQIIIYYYRKITIILTNKIIDKLSTRPAEIFNLYPKKGTIQVGSDADIIIISENNEIIKQENRHSRTDYTPYEGFELDYTVETTILRGDIIIQDNKLEVEMGNGQFVERKLIKKN